MLCFNNCMWKMSIVIFNIKSKELDLKKNNNNNITIIIIMFLTYSY